MRYTIQCNSLGGSYPVFVNAIHKVFLDVPFPYSEGPEGHTVQHFMRCLVSTYVYAITSDQYRPLIIIPITCVEKKFRAGLPHHG